MPTAAFTTLGCKVNQYETQRILDSFADAGFSVVPSDQPADVYVINTCSVTSQAEAKSWYAVRKAQRINPEAKLVVTGCAVQMDINRGGEREPVDVAVPNPEKLRALEYLYRSFPEIERAVRQNPAPREQEKPRGRTRATLKIQDGCSVMCSYCSIPFTRPVMTSRPWHEVLDEAKRLHDMGYHEAVLTGVLIGAYGPETGSEGPGFESLVQTLAEESGLERIRISSIEMHQVTDSIIRLAKEGQIVPHFHIPLQSGDDGVLRDMNRRYRQDDYLRLCEKLYRVLPEVTITTDIMVGFPTEDDAAFESSLKVCREVQFLKAHVFRFSPRYGTPADKWGDPVPPPIKQERAKQLAAYTTETGRSQVRRFLGTTARVLVERRDRGGLLEGTSDNWLTVKFAGPDSALKSIQWVQIEDERDGIAYGELAAAPKSRRVPLSVR